MEVVSISSNPDDGPDADPDDRWRSVIAAGLVAEDLSVTGLMRYAGAHYEEVTCALQRARSEGLIDDEGQILEAAFSDLSSLLTPEEIAAIHAAVARHLFASGPEGLRSAVAHTRAAGAIMRTRDTVELADRAGRLNLSVGEYQAAYDLLLLASEIAGDDDPLEQGARLCDLSQAAEALGQMGESRRLLRTALQLGETAQSPGLVARAAVMHTLPVDRRIGDADSIGFLDRAESFPQSSNAEVAITAARALAEMRIPRSVDVGSDRAWSSRAAIAQPLAGQAVAQSEACSREVRCTALLAWRATHGGPAHLERRLEVSTEALNLAQHLRLPIIQVEAAVWLAVDALESGNRRAFDEALSVARWVSETDGSARLRWKAITLATGAALIEEDFGHSQKLRGELREVIGGLHSSGFEIAEEFFVGQTLVRTGDLSGTEELLENGSVAAQTYPIARAGLGYLRALNGDRIAAIADAHWCLQHLDPESSYLLLATRIAAIATTIRDPDLMKAVIKVLSPWSDRVAVDADGWWCDGPVAVWLALLHHELGESEKSAHYIELAEPIARSLNDLHALRQISVLRSAGSAHLRQKAKAALGLSPREFQVMELIAEGYGNAQIASLLGFSLSTIRTDTSTIYRKLRVKSRAEAVAYFLRIGAVASI